MTAKEKAKELVDQYDEILTYLESKSKAKYCALIAVDIAIKCCKDYDEVHENYTTQVNYWQEVKNELNKLQ